MSVEVQPDLFEALPREYSWEPPGSYPDISQYKWIGYDTETTGKNAFKDTIIGRSICLPSDRDPRKWKRYYFPTRHKGGGNLDPEVTRRWWKDAIRGKNLCGLNIKFDILAERRDGVDFEVLGVKPHDVAFPPALLNENRRSGFGLADLCKEYLPEGERKVYPSTIEEGKFHLAHAGEVALRAEQDAYLALRLYQTTLPLIHKEELDKVLDLEDSIILAVAEMEWNGALIDRPKLERWIKEAEAKYEHLMLELWKLTGRRINPNSHVDMKTLFDLLKLDYPQKLVREGESITTAVTFEEEFLDKIEHPIIKKALETRKTSSIISKYLKKYLKALDGNNILRYQLHQLRGDENGTVMGRFSSAAPSTGGANIQQVPKCDKQISDNWCPEWMVRALFIPENGFDWIKGDQSQVEYRIFSHYAKNKNVLEAYRENPRMSYHKMIHAIIQAKKPDFPYWACKNANFASIYGAGRDKLSLMFQMTREEADPLIDVYDQTMPEVRQLQNRAGNVAKRRGYVKTYLGRRRRYPNGERTHSALHAVVSGSAADVYKLTLRDLYMERKNVGIHKLRLSVHDEFDGDVARDPKFANQIQELIEIQRVPLDVPILWEVETGKNWALGKDVAK